MSSRMWGGSFVDAVITANGRRILQEGRMSATDDGPASGRRGVRPGLRFLALTGAVALIAGLTPIGARMATSELPPLSLAFVRFGAAGGLLALTMRLTGRRWSFRRRDFRALAVLALLCVPLNQVGFLFGIKLANATHGAIAYALTPVLVFWVSLLLGRAVFSGRLAMATGLAFAGAVAVVLSRSGGGEALAAVSARFLRGDALLLLAVLTWSLFTVFSQPVVQRYGPIETLSAVFLLGALMHVPLVGVDLLFFDMAHFHAGDVTWRGVWGALFITLATSYVNYLLWYTIIAHHDVTRSAIVVNASFLITVIVEWAAFGEPVSAVLFGGVGLTLLSVVLANTGKRGARLGIGRGT